MLELLGQAPLWGDKQWGKPGNNRPRNNHTSEESGTDDDPMRKFAFTAVGRTWD